jgi:hypothetical protein
MIKNVVRELDSYIVEYEEQIKSLQSKIGLYQKEMQLLINARDSLLDGNNNESEEMFSFEQFDNKAMSKGGTVRRVLILEFLQSNGPSKSDEILKHLFPRIKHIERPVMMQRLTATLANLLKKGIITSEYSDLSARLKVYKIADYKPPG